MFKMVTLPSLTLTWLLDLVTDRDPHFQGISRTEYPQTKSDTMADKNKDVLITTAETLNDHNHEEIRTTDSEQNQKPQERLTLVEKWWIWEFAALTVSFAALIGLVGLLVPLNQKSVPNWVVSQTTRSFTWGFSVSINSILSIFSTLIKSMVLIPVAEAIGQLKWLWFSDGHRLSDFERFEAAEDGPLGAILLIWAMKGRSLVCLGALIIIASLALDFSFQQLVTYPPVPRPVGTAYMPATSTYSSYATKVSGIAAIPFNIPDAKMQSALKIGMEGIDVSVSLEPQCSTGNCTWSDTVVTLGVCSECYDATPKLEQSCESSDTGNYCNYSLPNGLSLSSAVNALGSTTIFTTSGEFTNTSFFDDLKSPIGVLSTIGTQHDYQTAVPVFSNQCALSFCIQKYNVSINENNLTSHLLDIYQDKAAVPDNNGDLQIVTPAEFMRDAGHNDSITFTVTNNASSAFAYYFFANSQFSGSIQQSPTLHSSGENGFLTYIFPMDTAQLTQAMSYLASNMTNAIRMSAAAPTSSTPTLGIGTTFQDIPKVNVVWWWLYVPGTLLILTLAFLIATVLVSRKRGAMLWKKSALAPFCHPLYEDGREKLANAQGRTELGRIAQKVSVKSELTEKGYQMVQPGMSNERR